MSSRTTAALIALVEHRRRQPLEYDHQHTFDLVPLQLCDALHHIICELQINDSERLHMAASLLACSIARLTPNLN